MRICIYGLGAVGGLVAARLAASGQPVSAVARGATLAAVRQQGLTLIDGPADAPQRRAWPVTASDDPAALGVQDLVILAVKTTALREVAGRIAPLLGPDTAVLSAMNGIPWWFCHGLRGAPAGLRLDSVDPGGEIAAAIDPARVLGCVTHLSASTPAPGVVRHGAGLRLIVGEPAGGADTPRARAVRQVLAAAGFEVEAAACIQQEIWFKLWGNMTVNPISALTGATADLLLDDPLVRGFMSHCMREAAAIGARLGLPIAADPEERHAVTRRLGAFRTSMLQDLEAGKPLELDALVGAVLELGRQVGVETPHAEALFGLGRTMARVRGLYPRAGGLMAV